MNKKDQLSNIQQLVQSLGSKDGMKRKESRESLVKIGKEAINPLLELLEHPKHVYRWEAMLTLKEIGGQTLIPVFISKLDDEESDIRWIASEGLIKQGKNVIKPLLKLLMEKSESVFVLAGSHFIFNELYKQNKLPDKFPVDKVMPLLKNTGLSERIKITVFNILNEMDDS